MPAEADGGLPAAPDVSVVLITYNHEAYVGQAIDSVLGQRTDFEFELLISEDCSTDRTRSIIEDYQRRYPDRIRLFLSERNLCDNSVLTRAWQAARGRYVAVFDGDDYWTAPDKLQRQRDLLDAHPEYSGCCHNVMKVWEDGSRPAGPYHPADKKPVVSEADVWMENGVASCSIMYRRSAVAAFPPWYVGAAYGDWPLHMLAARWGPIGYLPEIMAVYRKHGGGYWSGMGVVERQMRAIEFLQEAATQFGPEYRRLAAAAIAGRRLHVAEALQAARDAGGAWRQLRLALAGARGSRLLPIRRVLQAALRIKAPALNRALQFVRSALPQIRRRELPG